MAVLQSPATLAVGGRQCKRPSTSTRAPLRSRLAGGFSARPGADTGRHCRCVAHEDPRSAEVPSTPDRFDGANHGVPSDARRCTSGKVCPPRRVQMSQQQGTDSRLRTSRKHCEKRAQCATRQRERFAAQDGRIDRQAQTKRLEKIVSRTTCGQNSTRRRARKSKKQGSKLIRDGRNGGHVKAHNFFGDTSGLTKSTKEKHGKWVAILKDVTNLDQVVAKFQKIRRQRRWASTTAKTELGALIGAMRRCAWHPLHHLFDAPRLPQKILDLEHAVQKEMYSDHAYISFTTNEINTCPHNSMYHVSVQIIYKSKGGKSAAMTAF